MDNDQLRLQRALEAVEIGLWDWDIETDRQIWSPAMFKLFDLDREGARADPQLWLSRVHPDDRGSVVAIAEAAIQRHAPTFTQDYRIILRDGSLREIHSSGCAFYDEVGRPTQISGTCQDVTAQRRAERGYAEQLALTQAAQAENTRLMHHLQQQYDALRESEDHYRHTVELNPQVPWIADPDGNILDFNARWLELTGMTREQALGGGWVEASHPDDLPRMVEAWSHALRTGEPYDIEHRIRLADGSFRWMRSQARPRRNPQGHIVCWYGTTEDISARKGAEEALQASLTRTERIRDLAIALSAAQTPEEVAETALSHTITVLDATGGAVRRLSGDGQMLDALAIIGDSVDTYIRWQRLPLDDHYPATDAARDGRIALFDSQPATLARYPHLATVVAQLNHHAFVALPLERDGVIIGSLSLWYDRPHTFSSEQQTFLEICRQLCAQALERAYLYSAERRTRVETEETLALLDTLLTNAPLGFTFLDTELRYRRINTALADINGVPAEAHLGRTIREVVPSVAESAEQLFRHVLVTGEPLLGLEIIGETPAAPGVQRIWEESCYPVRTSDGRVIGVGVVVKEVTEQKAAERALRQTNEQLRLALGREEGARAQAEAAVRVRDQFLSVASHELKTPLTALLGNVQMVQRRLAKEATHLPRLTRNLEQVVTQVKRLDRLVTLLLDVSRIEQGHLALERSELDLVALVQQVADEFEPHLGNHTLDLELPSSAVLMQADGLRLGQALQNLIQNALKYSPAGGPVRVTVNADGEQVRITVSDSGLGIPANDLAHLFERFYRASNVIDNRIDGMGIGLFVVKEIVELHGGTISVASQEGKGSTFTLSWSASAPSTTTLPR